MKKNFLKSTWAIVAGFIFVVIASILTDVVLIKTGLMKQVPLSEHNKFYFACGFLSLP